MSDRVQCLLCPHVCVLGPGERGICKVRLNIDGELVSLVYGLPVAVHIDPVEKKPLYHFIPGSSVFSLATAGCNLSCRYCQNWEISQASPEDIVPYNLPPESVVEQAENMGCQAIAYTYTEPIVFYEYMLDTAILAREAGIKNVLITCGYINEGPLREICQYIDAVNVDLKSIRNDFYRDICGASLQPVLRTLQVIRELNVWLEVTNLIIPTLNDSTEEIEELSQWIFDNLGTDVPLHFSRFFPMYQLTDFPPTPVATLILAKEIAQEKGLHFVYVGNAVTEDGANTFCPFCGELLLERQGYTVVINMIEDGKCSFCSESIPGIWEAK